MLRGIAIACALCVAAALVFAGFQYFDDDADAALPAPFPAIDPAVITGIDITGPDGDIALRRGDDGRWRLTVPVEDAADAKAVDAALGELSRLEIGPEPVSESADDWPQFEVATADVLTIQLAAPGQTFPPLHIGRGRFVRIGNLSGVYEVFGFSRAELARDLRHWRDRTIFHIEPAAVTGIEVIAKDGTRARAIRRGSLESAHEPRALPEKVWSLADGDRSAALDPDVVAEVFRRVISLEAWNVAEGATFAAAGLDSPTLTIVIHTRDGDHALAIGERDGGFVPVGVAGKDRVWLLPAREAAALALGPRQWRKKTLLDQPADAIAHIRAEVGGKSLVLDREKGHWRSNVPGSKVDAAAADAYADALAMAEATQIAPPDAELGAIAATITVTFREARPVTLRVSERGDGTYLVQSSAREDLLIVDRHTAARIVPDPATLATPAAP